MKRVIILMVALVLALSIVGASRSWKGSLYTAAGTSDFGINLTDDAPIGIISIYAPDGNVAVVYFAAGDTVVPMDVEPGDSDAFITYPAGVPANEYGVLADSMYVDRTVSTEVFTYWR